MKPALTLAVLAAAALLPVGAQAAGISWNYWEVDYLNADIDGFSDRLDGFGVAGSIEVRGPVFLYANWLQVDTSIAGLNVSEEDTNVGLGYAWSLRDNLDLFGTVGWAHTKGEAQHLFRLSDDGYSVGVGARARFIDQLEVEGSVQYTDFSDVGSTTGLALGAQWYFTPGVAVNAGMSFSDDATTWALGLRGTWGR